ncbi:MAG: C-GCAxxG-C-C family protein [Clostridiales bacterium]|nr:C-GCAxxG-C-C family protein [Clostridiales bacterium]
MLKELIESGFGEKEDYNCAEKIIAGADAVYGLGLAPVCYKLLGAFGNGCGCEEYCGAVAGGVAALGVMFIEKNAHQSQEIADLTSDFIKEFRREASRLDCASLKRLFRTPQEKCRRVIVMAAAALDKTIAEAGR